MTRLRVDRGAEAGLVNPAGRMRRNNLAGQTGDIVTTPRQRLKRQPQAIGSGANGQRVRTSNAATAARAPRRGQTQPDPSPAVSRSQNVAEVVRVEAPSRYHLVVSFAQQAWPDCERELLALARSFGGADCAVILCRVGQTARDAGAAGADRLVRIEQADVVLQRADLLSACRQVEPDCILLPHSRRGAELARHLAAALGVRPAIGVVQMRDNHVLVPTADGRSEYRRPIAPIVTVRDTACRDAVAVERREARPVELVSAAIETDGLVDQGLQAADVSMLPLEEAEFIVSAGDGVTDFDAFARTARSLSATIAGSRVVCDAGLLARDRQIGASGHVARAECYVALGISGAPQHLEGIRNCVHVVAVNTDLHAAMVERADLAIIADAQKVMPALLRAGDARHD